MTRGAGISTEPSAPLPTILMPDVTEKEEGAIVSSLLVLFLGEESPGLSFWYMLFSREEELCFPYALMIGTSVLFLQVPGVSGQSVQYGPNLKSTEVSETLSIDCKGLDDSFASSCVWRPEVNTLHPKGNYLHREMCLV